MAKATCSIDGCDRPHRGRGWCATHYNRWRRHGTTDDVRPSPEERFWANVDCYGPGGCWLWISPLRPDGYAGLLCSKRRVLAHRFSYELLVGPIPAGLELDHLCRVHHCVNPAHLEAVTHRENILRGVAPAAFHARKTHCPQGHPYSGDNLIAHNGSRECRTCENARQRRRYRARQALMTEEH